MPPKLTQEEKKRLQEAAQEAKVKKERRRHWDHMEREIQIGQLTLEKARKLWMDMMIKITLPKIRAELEFTANNFERVVDVRNVLISKLQGEWDEAEEQYAFNFKSILEAMEVIMGYYRDFTEKHRKDYEENRKEILKHAVLERASLSEMHEERVTFFKTALFGLEQKKKQEELHLTSEILGKMNVEYAFHKSFFDAIDIHFSGIFVNLWRESEQFLRGFYERFESVKAKFDRKLEKELQNCEQISQQNSKLQSRHEKMRKLSAKLKRLQQTHNEEVHMLNSAIDHYKKQLSSSQELLMDLEAMTKRKITHLVGTSIEAIDHLEGILKKGENILGQVSLCNRLETIEETLKVHKPDGRLRFRGICDFHYENYAPLEGFFKKIGKAEAVFEDLQKEKRELLEENTALKNQIRKFCLCLNCPAPDLGK